MTRRSSSRALRLLPHRAQTLRELRELSRHGGMLRVGQHELCQQLHRALMGERRTVEVPTLFLAIFQRRRLQMPANDRELRLEMLEGPESLHDVILVYPKPAFGYARSVPRPCQQTE